MKGGGECQTVRITATTKYSSIQEHMDCLKHNMLDVLMHSPHLKSNKNNNINTTESSIHAADVIVLAKTWAAVQEMSWKYGGDISSTLSGMSGEITLISNQGTQYFPAFSDGVSSHIAFVPFNHDQETLLRWYNFNCLLLMVEECWTPFVLSMKHWPTHTPRR